MASEKQWVSDKEREEKRWASELLAAISANEVDEEELISYYDWLNLMLGRKKFTVELYEYDISNGQARYLSMPFLGTYFEGIWHTGIVAFGYEYWFGGHLFQSRPETTPFGAPYRKTVLGTTSMFFLTPS